MISTTPDGHQISSIWTTSGFPGTVDNGLDVFFPGGVPGSTLKFESGSNLVGWTTHTYEVQAAETMLPLPWAAGVDYTTTGKV